MDGVFLEFGDMRKIMGWVGLDEMGWDEMEGMMR